MVLKVVKAVWFISMVVAAASLLYVYAGLPETVDLGHDLRADRSGFFYATLGAVGVLNALGFVIRNLFQGQPAVPTWYYGLLIFFHLYLIVALLFINLSNSLEKFDYPRMGFLINGSVTLLLMWAAGYPLYQFLQKKMLTKAVD